MAKKVLVGIVTYDQMDYCIKQLAGALKSQEFTDFDVLFVDNSAGNYSDKLESMGFRAIKDARKGTRIGNIISGRNIIREEFLKGGYEYLFFLDSDVIIPKNAIARLLSMKKQIASGVYIVAKHINGKPYALPCILRKIGDEGFIHFSLKEAMGENIIEADAAGLGCCLIHKDVLKDIIFRNTTGSDNGGEDITFFSDAKKNGFNCYVDTSVKCFHMVYPEDDPRHRFHMFETHIKKPGKTYTYSTNIDGLEIR